MTPTLTDHQWDAVKLAANWYRDADQNRHLFEEARYADPFEDEIRTMLGQGQDFFFGGFAGTGKTTVLPAVIEKMGLDPNREVAFCAPTGKAAKVMGEKLRAFGMNVQPTTIHKLIYLPKRAKADAIQSEIDNLSERVVQSKAEGGHSVSYDGNEISFKDADAKIQQLSFDLSRLMSDNDGPKFHIREYEQFPEDYKLIVVDEGSMVGAGLARDLAYFGRPILAFGDPGQLPPVGDIYGFDCDQPDAFLTEIHRQALDNPIIQLATMARQGKMLPLGVYGDGVKVVDRRNDDVTLDMDREAMVLCGTHNKRWTLTKKIRKALGYSETGPCSGEPLLVCKNSTKIPSMVNGTIVTNLSEHGDLQQGVASFELEIQDTEGTGEIRTVRAAQPLFEEHHFRQRNAYSSPSSMAFKAKRDCEHLDWGHVLTCHKSQGSQWDEVVVHDESGVFRDDAKRWLYTAVTRAAERLTVVV